MKKNNTPEDSNAVDLSAAREKYNYQALLRGYQEVFESKLHGLEEKHPHDVLSFAQIMEEAQDYMVEVNDKNGWSQASEADVRELEKLCAEMDEILHSYAPFFDRRKIMDVGQRLLNREYLGKRNPEVVPEDFETARKRRSGGIR